MGHQNTRGGAEFNRKVAIADRVERILAGLGKAEFFGARLAIDRVGCSS